MYNVEDFGAVHDGVTDDAPAIQAAIAAAMRDVDVTNLVVHFPAGEYRIEPDEED